MPGFGFYRSFGAMVHTIAEKLNDLVTDSGEVRETDSGAERTIEA